MPLDDIIRARRAERERAIGELREYASRLRARLGRLSMALYGSYARGDFNLWSDVDVIVVSERFRDREFVTRCIELSDGPQGLMQYAGPPRRQRRPLASPGGVRPSGKRWS
ncbi:MAG: nucleotidyltransferase domain-containing protein [Acidilobus sp.]